MQENRVPVPLVLERWIRVFDLAARDIRRRASRTMPGPDVVRAPSPLPPDALNATRLSAAIDVECSQRASKSSTVPVQMLAGGGQMRDPKSISNWIEDERARGRKKESVSEGKRETKRGSGRAKGRGKGERGKQRLMRKSNGGWTDSVRKTHTEIDKRRRQRQRETLC
eukprot:3142605-Rhodomonas_salina.3